jgi:Lar family restriction alleviation protein
MSELKPCPFCGGDKFEVRHDYSDIQGYINAYFLCTKCGATSRDYYYTDSQEYKKAVIKHWNTRPAEDAKDREIERLKGALDKIYQTCFCNAPEKVAREFIKTVVHGALYKNINAPDSTKGVEK